MDANKTPSTDKPPQDQNKTPSTDRPPQKARKKPQTRKTTSQVATDRHNQQIADWETTRKMRERYANRIFWFGLGCTVVCFGMLIAAGMGQLDLDAWVLRILAGSIPTNAIGLMMIVASWLYPVADPPQSAHVPEAANVPPEDPDPQAPFVATSPATPES